MRDAYVLVGVDGSETARIAFNEAVREASWRDASVLALHVAGSPLATGHEFGHLDLDLVHQNAKTLLTDELSEIEKEYVAGFPIHVEPRVSIGHTGTEIMRIAEEEPVELVVMGSRGLGGFRGLLLGSVTTYLVHHLPCRLMIVPPPERTEY